MSPARSVSSIAIIAILQVPPPAITPMPPRKDFPILPTMVTCFLAYLAGVAVSI
jgi:hypothetical protein